ncbi:DUF5977 domain-containing protein [Chryseobacterium salviniae]|uniref:DUF5977 domain-containing protein n=1 Tax=Chryseobacterium salviniae TaxID=3101750 RepID=A0ABU6HSD9_9FLAO|nr:DUF5977 domain-containing protein [Chryseobacterium sp. T9W2-O]MEC3875818.1 DUF5977 domain-containing protein [Chryseobacterium sp. T9W2-O]
MKQKVLLPLILTLLSINKAYSQEVPKVMPPSPNASALAQYANQPVSNYTGVPTISIPLYSVKSGEIELPISVSYHASGIKVSQEAGLVGLGWAFNAGGAITRSVNGVDDLDSFKGYVTLTDLPSANNDNVIIDDGSQYYNDYKEINTGARDAKPDILYYNFGGETGKMIFEKRQPNTNKIKGIPLKQTNSTFVYDFDTKQWEVTDGNGWKYYFTVREISRGYSASDDRAAPAYLVDDLQRSESFDRLDPSINYDEYISAWYISKIVTPKDDSIIFEYDASAGRKSISQLSFYEQESYYGNPLINYGKSWYGNFLEKKNSISVSMTASDNINLTKIRFKNGYIDFHTSDREDQRPANNFGTYSPKPQKLDSFEVFNGNGESIKKVEFGYSYFGDSYSGKNKENYWRLKLNRVQESFYDNSTATYKGNPPYTFTYSPVLFPDKTSASIDHWGYFNGSDNDHLMWYDDVTQYLNGQGPILEQSPNPSYFSKTYQSFTPAQLEYGFTANGQRFPFLDGGYRESDPIYMKAGILTQINYPTGGATRFTYEPNKYNNGDSDVYNYETGSSSVYADGDSSTDEVSSFYLSNYTRVKINCNIFNTGQSSTLYGIKALIQDSDGTDIIRFTPSVNSFSRSIQAVLPPGLYYIKANTYAPTQSLTISIFVNFLNKTLTTGGVVGGGLRILKQESLDKDGSVKLSRNYSYTLDNSAWTSGVPMSDIQHIYRDGGSSEYTNESPAFRNVVVCSSENNTPLSSSAQGNYVGYSQVTVSDVDQSGNTLGRSVYSYSNNPDEEGGSHLPGMPIKPHMDNGNLLKEEYYNASNIRLKVIENSYEKDVSTLKVIKGIFTKTVLKDPPNSSPSRPFYARLYRLYSEWWHPKQTIETNYDMNGNNPLVTTTNYSYENPLHKNVTKITTTRSTGEIEIIRNKYAQDLSSGIDETQATITAGMAAQNNINPVIQTEVTVDGKLVKGNINNFRVKNYLDQNNVSRSMYLPNNVKTLKIGTASDYDKRVDFVDYGSYGNITEARKSDGIHSVYIWGYKEEYPVAKVDNTTLSAVEAVLTATELANIKNGMYDEATMISVLNKIRIALPDALVTTYTYSPLVGVTSITPPSGVIEYYKYDFQNRLERIVDINGKILKEFKYAYAPVTSSTFYNSYQDKTFTRNNCGTSGIGNLYIYSVPAGTYSSDLSLLAANQKALDDINANGQNAANTNGTCTPISCSLSFNTSQGIAGGGSISVSNGTNYKVSFGFSSGSNSTNLPWNTGVKLATIVGTCKPIAEYSSYNGQVYYTIQTNGDVIIKTHLGTIPPNNTSYSYDLFFPIQ